MPASKRQRPSAWSHGLTSRLARVEVSEEVNRLAEALHGGSPAEHRLLEAAREAAEALIHLHRVQTLRRLAEEASALLHLDPLSYAPMRKLTLWTLQKEKGHATCRALVAELRLQAAEAGYPRGADITTVEGELSLMHSLAAQPDEVRRLRDHERRALSRRKKALRRLDYEQIEVERRK